MVSGDATIADLGSRLALAFVMGVVAYIGALHLWLWRGGRGAPSHAWVAGWCLASVAFQAARIVQVSTADPQAAVLAARFQVSTSIVLAYCLAGVSSTLGGRRWTPRRAATWGAAALAAFAAGVATPLFVDGATTDLRVDWDGHGFLGVPVRASAGWIAVLVVVVAAHVARGLRDVGLEPRERGAMLAGLAVYALLALTSIASAIRVLDLPLLLPYAPLAIALSLNFLLVHRHRRLTTELEHMVEDRTRALRESEERSRRLVDDAPVGVVALDLDGAVTALNKSLLRILGAPDASPGATSNVFTSPVLARAGVSDAVRRCLETGQPSSGEFAYASRWGRELRLRAHLVPLRDHEGRTTGAQAVVEDVSERVALEQRLRQSRKMEAVGALAAGIAHEINNPMAYVLTNLRLLRDELGSIESEARKLDASDDLLDRVAEGSELLDDALEGVSRAVRLVREVKEFSHGRVAEQSRVALGDLLDDALRYASPQRRPGVRIERDFAPVAPVLASPEQLRQVFLNLIVNALQAVGDDGRVRIALREEDGVATVTVQDDGCGIAPDLRDRIFEPFFTTKSAGEGTGLGLYFSYEIVRMHGGELRVESRPGGGTTFEVRLPRDESRPDGVRRA